MLYTVNVLSSSGKPVIWDSMESVTAQEFQTANITPVGETADEETVLAANAERRPMGSLEKENINIYCDGLGCIYAGMDAEHVTQLTRCTWQEIGSVWLRVELIRKPQATWDELVVQQLSMWRRFLHKHLKRTCGQCLYFDHHGAEEWRMKTTHAFGGASAGVDVALYEKMWDDVTKQAAIDHKAPDFLPAEFGYCPKRDCGLGSSLIACAEFKKK